MTYMTSLNSTELGSVLSDLDRNMPHYENAGVADEPCMSINGPSLSPHDVRREMQEQTPVGVLLASHWSQLRNTTATH